jgi:hypothetical protein
MNYYQERTRSPEWECFITVFSKAPIHFSRSSASRATIHKINVFVDKFKLTIEAALLFVRDYQTNYLFLLTFVQTDHSSCCVDSTKARPLGRRQIFTDVSSLV